MVSIRRQKQMRTLEFPIAKKTKLYIRGGYATIAILVLSLMLMVSTIWLNGWFFLAGFILCTICCVINSMEVIEPEDTAYVSVLGGEPKKHIKNGFHWIFPFVSEVVSFETRPTDYIHVEKDINMPAGIPVEETATIAYQITEEVQNFARKWYNLEKAFSGALKAANRAVLTSYTCDELLDENSKTRKVALKEEVRQELEAKFLDVLREKYYKAEMDKVFISISLPAIDIVFPQDYINERRKVVEAEQKAKAAEALKKAQITEAEAVAESTEIIATADAKAIELKGGAENRVLKRKGEILTDKPAISENAAAQRPPQTLVVTGNGGGGITPVMDILKGLYPHKDDEETTAAPSTPTPPTP